MRVRAGNRSIMAAVIGCLALMPGVSRSETIGTTAELLGNKGALAYVFSPPMMTALFRLGADEDKKFGLQLDCKTQYQVKPSR